jgi:hypothetical protein
MSFWKDVAGLAVLVGAAVVAGALILKDEEKSEPRGVKPDFGGDDFVGWSETPWNESFTKRCNKHKR